MMGKLQHGVPDKHVLKSHGADADILKFYCTQYASTYGSKWSKFEPRTGQHTGSGYVSNVRPTIQYCSRLDEVDNPPMGRIVADNYHSITERSFRPYTTASGAEPLPNSVYHAGSGFVRGKQVHVPTVKEARAACIGARISSAPPVDILPRHKPVLHKIQPKDPVELENGGYGPECYTTETGERFKGIPSSQPDLYHKSVGPMEGSGFTHNQNDEPITFHSNYAHRGDAPGCLTPRPTGLSITDTDYRPSMYATGREPLPRIAYRSDHDSGFTSGTKGKTDVLPTSLCRAYDRAEDQPPSKLERVRKQDPMEYINMTHPRNYPSVAHATLIGQQRPDPTDADLLGATSVGHKENTGFTSNNYKHVWTADQPGRFITEYQTRYLDRMPIGADREGHVWGGVQRPKEDGFTKSTHMHKFGPEFNTTDTLRRLEPYVARSIKVRDTFYDDHTYDAKMRSAAVAS